MSSNCLLKGCFKMAMAVSVTNCFMIVYTQNVTDTARKMQTVTMTIHQYHEQIGNFFFDSRSGDDNVHVQTPCK
jgi:hypothetical protein